MSAQLSSTDHEPPLGTVVEDCDGERWERIDTEDYRKNWYHVDQEDDPRSWTWLAGNYGPVVVIE